MPDVDVLVIGAGPAGAGAARRAAMHGLSVVLVDRAGFPRNKVCGDALIPDALGALRELGLSSVLSSAARAARLRVFAPGGLAVPFTTESACLPRQIFDNALLEGAIATGARFVPHWRLRAPEYDGATIAGASFTDAATGARVRIRAAVTILATGAAAGPLETFGVCRRAAPSATAARMYVQVDARTAAEFSDLLISYGASGSPGYGWIFPGPQHTFNVGVGYFYDARRRFVPVNLRVLLDRFLRRFPPAVALMRSAISTTPLKGAPLRTAMEGAEFARPGLLVVGEAAGLTYSLTGEGIGKALQSGMLAADIVAQYRTHPRAAVRVSEVYASTLVSRYASRFRAYKTAQQWIRIAAVGNFLAARAARTGFARRQLEALLADEGDPRELFSVHGLVRAVWS